MESFSEPGDLLLAIADACCACLELSSPNGAPGECGVYWGSQAPPDDLFCDCDAGGFLNTWSEGIQPTNSFPQPFNGPVKSAVGGIRLMMPVAVRLVRPCWPTQTNGPDGRFVLPSRATTEPLSLNLMMDMAILECCILSEMTRQDGIFGQCSAATAPRAVPDRNRGGCAGASLRFMVEIGSCCVPPSGS